ncbi:MAG: hypothetical protein ACRD3O_19165 [Terriglobia bacterium]
MVVPLIRGNDAGWRKDWLYSYYEFPGPHMAPKTMAFAPSDTT